MKRTYTNAEVPNAIDVLRKAGYSYFKDPQSGEESFVVRLTSEFYPRFHLYVISTEEQVVFNLHLDQKKPSYGDENMHSGEYDGPTIERELQRIDSWVRSGIRQRGRDTSEQNLDSQQQKLQGASLKRWWKKIFG